MPLAALTVGQFRDLMREFTCAPAPVVDAEKRYVYGIKGIEELFRVSHATAQHYKDTFLQPAIIQNGRKIMVDVDMAMDLFHKEGKRM